MKEHFTLSHISITRSPPKATKHPAKAFRKPSFTVSPTNNTILPCKFSSQLFLVSLVSNVPGELSLFPDTDNLDLPGTRIFSPPFPQRHNLNATFTPAHTQDTMDNSLPFSLTRQNVKVNGTRIQIFQVST
jgi:hypothetical protein